MCVGVCFTHTAVGPVDVEKGKGEKSLVAILWEQLLFKLDKISLEVNHFWCTAVSPAHKDKFTAAVSVFTRTRVK